MKYHYIIKPSEVVIDSKLSFNTYSTEITQRVQWLCSHYLKKIFDAGWEILYQDPQDKRLWELIYYDKRMWGYAVLKYITKKEANIKYRVEKILPDEIIINSDINIVRDENTMYKVVRRIFCLTNNYLKKIFDAGWEILYQDPQDKRFWEKTYYNGKENLMLRCLTEEEAKSKYVVETIKSDETIIDSDSSNILGRKNAHRIHCLTVNYLENIAKNGWGALYKDPKDNRFWELTYPKSEMQGGGPPLLKNIDISMVLLKYGKDKI